jgi:hypothetical protein
VEVIREIWAGRVVAIGVTVFSKRIPSLAKASIKGDVSRKYP